MNAALAVVAAFLGALLGGVAAALLIRRLSHPQPPALGGYDESALRPVLARVNATKEVVERVQQDLNDLSREVRKLAAGGQAGGQTGGQQTTPQRTPSTPEDRWGREPGGTMRPGDDRGSPLRPGPGHGSQPGGSGEMDTSGRQTAPAGGDFGAPFERPPAAGGDIVLEDPYATQWDAGGPSSGPPANAVNVEARDDRIVASSSYPPEAWLEIGPGPAEGQVTLNPAVALNEYALRRLSTFFEWQGSRAGATYQTVRPASVRWDDGQRVGTLIHRGLARPR